MRARSQSCTTILPSQKMRRWRCSRDQSGQSSATYATTHAARQDRALGSGHCHWRSGLPHPGWDGIPWRQCRWPISQSLINQLSNQKRKANNESALWTRSDLCCRWCRVCHVRVAVAQVNGFWPMTWITSGVSIACALSALLSGTAAWGGIVSARRQWDVQDKLKNIETRLSAIEHHVCN